jgi:hypothetical protein
MFTPVVVYPRYRPSRFPFYSGWFMATRFVLVRLYLLGGLDYLAGKRLAEMVMEQWHLDCLCILTPKIKKHGAWI